ncbi:TPA: ThiF family adenylyltransferase [Acinetobacter baumannii]|nr:ThiF family adenylyltransferase [Acinetobacter baumannii]
MITLKNAQSLSKLGYVLADPFSINFKKRFNQNLWIKEIKINEFKIKLAIFFSDWDFIISPSVYLFEDDLKLIGQKYKHFKLPLPHFLIEPSFTYDEKKAYNFCYALHDKVEINRKDLTQIIFFIEKQIEANLLKLINLKTLINEINQEIAPTWMILSEKYEERFKADDLFIDFKNEKGVNQTTLNYKSTREDNIQKTVKINFIGITINHLNFPLLSKYFDENGKITFGKMLNLIKDLDPSYLRTLKYYLSQEFKNKRIHISLVYQKHIFSFCVEWKKNYRKVLQGNIDIISSLLNEEVLPIYIQNYKIKDIVERNLEGIKTKNLSSLRILQIGAGAIGGYVADALTKIGAGTSNNEYYIVDKDYYGIENIGRHLLGKKYIGSNKASAIVSYLKENLNLEEDSNIKSLPTSINKIENGDISDFSNYDLVIDATGQIEVAEYLNERIIILPVDTRPNLLHLWIYGNGECVQALWNQPDFYEKNGGCISCIHQSGINDYDINLDPLNDPNYRKILGLGACAAYTPYAISSSLLVASLTVDILLEWLNTGILRNNYFTRYSISYKGDKIEDQQIFAKNSCPHCKIKSIS